MKDNINEIASIIAVAILADGEVEEQEKQLLADLEQDTEIPGLAASVEQVLSMANVLTDDQLTDLLYQNAEKINGEYRPKVFEAAITTVLADGVVSEDEISNILTLAEALDIPVEKAVARLLFQVQETEGDLVVDVEEDLEDFIVVGGKTRYTSWKSFEKMLSEKSYPSNLIEGLQAVHDWTVEKFGDKATINFTPNFMTLSCNNPSSRSKTFCFVRMRNESIRFEYNGNMNDIKNSTEFSDTIKAGVTAYFNQISTDKI
jgi:hypothetical protein